jgi:hypothetical protein
LVVGYRGGNYNSLGGFYEFRQRHAHSWVEAYLEPEDVTESMLPPGQTAPYGAWMRLDPTPPSDEGEDFLERTGLLAKADELYGFARLMWLDYVVNMNAQRQQEAVINPIVSGTRSAEESLLGRDHWTQKDLRSRIESAPLWLYGLAALTAVLLVGLVVRMLKLRRRARHEEDMARRRRPPRPAPFYDRLVALLRRHGLARTSAQTQREFAGLVGGQLSESGLILDSALVRDCAAVPRHVVEAYYRVRFGGQELATEELFELDQSLDQLEEALKLHRGLPRRKLQRAAIPTAPMPPSPRESRRG